MHAILSDARAMRYWSSLPHTQIEQTRAWLAGMIDASPEESCDFILELQGRVIGKAGCLAPARDRLHPASGLLGPRPCP